MEERYYPDGPKKTFAEASYMNNLISSIRIAQRRMRLVEGKSVFDNRVFYVWKGKKFNPTGPKDSKEDIETFCEQSEVCPTCDSVDNICRYDNSGKIPSYIAWLDVLDVIKDENKTEKSEQIYAKLKALNNTWISNQTRSLIVDFVYYNPYVKIYSYGIVTLEFSEIA